MSEHTNTKEHLMGTPTEAATPFDSSLTGEDQKLWGILTDPDFDEYDVLELTDTFATFNASTAPDFDIQVAQVVKMLSGYFTEQDPGSGALSASLPQMPEADEFTQMLQVECCVDSTRNQWLGEAKRIRDWTDSPEVEGPAQALAIGRVVFEAAQRLVAAAQTMKAA